ncbi:hypothetical protein KUV95_02955 [Microbulbifer agarilyticus]|uniref:hypothetical protein n=1 Tax=Microbulbifer agarilyticus TaxID=260552 RepID=UPI001C95E21D|nr:hypothetical protein [Microbulbifer agarilyticus]MBY6210497.1 hypothetical protein [Microbulbifer agarilyticus]
MKKSALGVALGASLLSAVAMADVKQYIDAGYSMDQVIALAQSEGLSTEEAVEQALAVAPEKAADIAVAAIKAGANPASAEVVVTAAVTAGANPEAIAAAAIAAGADATVVTAATAAAAPAASALAGTGAASTPTASTPIPPAPVVSSGAGAGGGGGTVASDN